MCRCCMFTATRMMFVPWDENTGVLAERYRKLGGNITLIPKPGVGHHPHGLTDPAPIVEFIVKHISTNP